MDPEKKPYMTPRLTTYGKVEEITQQGGFSSTDVPQGTPVIGNSISSVVS
jgi:hypothetical protein